jgi:D-sedoheptulose 7-phosphate isomerase
VIKNKINKYYKSFLKIFIEALDLKKIDAVIKQLNKLNKNKILVFGNGGSSAIANHFTIDMIKNTKKNVLNFSNDSLITCFSNDYGYENWMKTCVEKKGAINDILIVISSSGESKNIVNACKIAKKKKFRCIISFTGFKKNNSVSRLSNYNFWVNSKNYNFIENCHQFIILFIADYFSKKLN